MEQLFQSDSPRNRWCEFKPHCGVNNETFNCVILPKAQVQAFQFQLHISYFLQNCKKGKPDEMDLPLLKNDITIFLEMIQQSKTHGILCNRKP
jgi:hypothetical protein